MLSQSERRRDVVFAPAALRGMSRGFCDLASLLATTLGPQRGPVWHANGDGVELLTNSGIIARRVVEVPDRLHNAGAMQLRHLVWRVQEYFGDGGATAAVLARAMVGRANALVAAGVDPVTLRFGMESSLEVAIGALEAQRVPVDSPTTSARMVSAVLADPDIAGVLAEMIDILGAEAVIHLEMMASPYLDRIYVEGGYWKAQPAARATLPPGTNELVLRSPRVLVADGAVLDTDDLLPALDLIARDPVRRPLVIVGAKLTGKAQDVLNLNVAQGTVAAYVVSPNAGPAHHHILSDIALATGAELLSDVRGFPPRLVHPAWLGTARQIVLTRDGFSILEGGGDPECIRQRLRDLREQIARSSDPDATGQLRERLGSLTGGIGILQIGGLTQAERDDKRRHVERAIRVLPDLVGAGLVPGGGIALLACRPALQHQYDAFGASEQRFGVDIMIRAIEAPFLQLAQNSRRMVPAVALQRVTESDHTLALDALTGELVPIADATFADSLAVLRGALRMATSAAIELITTGAVVLPEERKRPVSTDP